jgi:hypothetical protein
MFWCRHKRVEVDAGAMAYRLMELRVDIVRATLKGLHLVAFLCEQCHQSPGNRCLARAAGGCCDEKSAFHGDKDTHFSFFLYVNSFFFVFFSSLFTLFCIFAHELRQSGG